MAFLQWRRFNFFDKEVVKDEGGQVFDGLKGIDISVCASGRGQIVIGDYEGNIHFLNRNLELSTFKAYELRITHLCQVKQQGILVTVGDDEPGTNPIIKVWNLEKRDKAGNPTCSRIVRAVPGKEASPVSALAVHENLNLMAVGFQDGTVVVYRGDVTRDRHSKSRVIHHTAGAVTGLAFRQAAKVNHLFVVTKDSVQSYNLTAKDHKEELDAFGCEPRCSVLSDTSQDNQFVIGRPDAVYFYQTDGRGPCLVFEGEKKTLQWYRGYLVVVGKENKAMPRPPPGGQSRDMSIVNVYDIQNKFIAYSAPLPDVTDVICEWGSLYILTGENRLMQLIEKDIQTKLEMLFKKNLYVLAINLAKSQHFDQDGLVDIFTQYGDHLYSKGDYDGAINQYVKTIGKLEPSYVIRKFLDAQRIHNLTAYLQSLHKAQLATEDHTTLLLNCYTKLKDTNKLDQFIYSKDKEVDFDVETAIKVCRQAGYYDHALSLAERHSQHEWYLKIQLEDIKDYQKALTYISKLGFYEAESNMKKYGKILMSEVPQQTTELLKRLCTDYRPSDIPLADEQTLQGGMPARIHKAPADEFIHIFVSNSSKLMEFLEHMIKVQPSSPSLLYNTLLELYLHDMAHDGSQKAELDRKSLDLLQNTDAHYDVNQALVLCQMHNYKAGILYLYERERLYQQILRYHMDHDEYVHIINTCKKFGGQDPNLWVQALAYFARKEENCRTQMMEVLQHIDRHNLLPPLLVVQTLAHNSTATLAVVKDYITRRLQQENDQIQEDERLIHQYRQETEKMRSQIQELKTSAKIFQVSKCSICNHPLELPSVHFLCQHSFHQHCFEGYAENETECPVCMPENRKILDIIRAQEQHKELHEQFHHQLERAPDGFSVVADYFGRGVFNKVTLITDSPAAPPPSGVNPFGEPPELQVKPAPPKPASKPAAAASNPFDDDDDSNNPFLAESTNPFGEPESTNPFGED